MTEDKDIIGTPIDNWKNIIENESSFNSLNAIISEKRELIYQGGGPVAIQKQHDKNQRSISTPSKSTPRTGRTVYPEFHCGRPASLSQRNS